MPDDLAAKFTPDYTPEQMESLGVYDALYRGQGPRLASLGEWKPEWISQHDPKGWAQWYKRYASGRRIPDEDERQMKRWLSFKARHGGPFAKNPTARRGWALRNWGIEPANLVAKEQRTSVSEMLDEYKLKAMQRHIAEQSGQLGKQANDPTLTALLPLVGLLGGGAVGAYRAPKGKKLKHGLIGAGVGGGLGLGGAILHNTISPPGQGGSKTIIRDTTGRGRSNVEKIKIPLAGPEKPIAFQEENSGEPLPRRSLGSQISRWYDRAGGLDRAIEAAQEAQQSRNPGVLDGNTWLKWKPDDVKKLEVPVRLVKNMQSSQVSGGNVTTGGNYNINERVVRLVANPPKEEAQGILEHELSHAAYLSGPDAFKKMRFATTKANPLIRLINGVSKVPADKKWQTDDIAKASPTALRLLASSGSLADANKYKAYLLDPAEVDVRLAEIKRIYAQQTGKLVRTPEQAAAAVVWFKKHMFEDPEKKLENYLRQNKSLPSIDAMQFDVYESLKPEQKQQLLHRMPELVQQQNNAFKFGMVMGKQADLLPEIQLQEHQQRIADRVTGGDNRLLVYHGLGSGKSLSALAAAEAAKKVYGDQYGVVVPAALKGNFDKEVKKFTTGSNPEIMSYTGLGLGKQFQEPPQTLVMDEAHRLRNPGGSAAQAASREARRAKNLLLLTGSPITNSPTDLANLLSLLHNKKITPEQFEEKFVGYKSVSPGVINWLRGIQSGEQPVVKNESELRSLLKGKVDYQPSKTPEGVNVDEQVVNVPLSPAQQKIQNAIRTKIPPGFLWKLDREFPLSRDELAKLNSFLTGLRQVSISTRPFRADKDPVKAFEQSAKLQQAFKDLQETLTSDERKKAIIYSNHIDAGLAPYAAALSKNNIPHALFHGSISPRERQKAVNEYNEGKLRALLIGPAGAEGLSTRGTSLIQLLDPHWHESRSQQAKGRGLRFDSHRDLPEELKNVAVKRYISSSEDPSWVGKLMGYQRERTGDEILESLAKEKEMLNDKFRQILKEEGAVKAGAVQWFREKHSNSILQLPWVGESVTQNKDKKKQKPKRARPIISRNGIAGAVGAGAAALPLISLHQDAFGAYPVLKERVKGLDPSRLYLAAELAKGVDAQGNPLVQHGDVGTYFGEPQSWFKKFKPNFSKLTQGGEWTSGTGTYHGMMLRPHNGDVQVLEGGDAFPSYDIDPKDPKFLTSPVFDYIRKREAEEAAAGKLKPEDVGLYALAKRGPDGTVNPRTDPNLRDLANNTSGGFFNRNFLAMRNAMEGGKGDAAKMPFFKRYLYYNNHFKRQGKLVRDYLETIKDKPEEREKVWGNLSERTTSPILVTRSDYMSDLLRNPKTRAIAEDRVNKAYRDYAYRPYDLFSAMRAGAGRVLFPKIAPQETQLGVNPTPEQIPTASTKPVCTEDYCVQPLAKTLSGLGTPLGVSPSQALPADMAAGTGFRPVGMIVPNPTAEAIKKYNLNPENPQANAEGLEQYKRDYRNKVLQWMRTSRNRRIMTGLAAAGLMGAAGYGGTKLIQNWWKKRQERLEREAKKKKPRTKKKPADKMVEVSKAAAAKYYAARA